MSRKSKYRVHIVRVTRKATAGRRKHYDSERELYREDSTVKKPRQTYPEQIVVKPRASQPNKYDEAQIKELVKLATESGQSLDDMKIDAKIERAEQSRMESVVKAFDIWNVQPVDMPSKDFVGNPVPALYKPSARVPSVDELQGKGDHVVDLPQTSISYNPTFLSQQRAIDQAAKQYISEDRAAAKLRAVRPSNITPEEAHEDHVRALLQYLIERSKEESTAIDSPERALPTASPDTDDTDDVDDADLAKAAAKIPLTDEVRRKLDANELEKVRMTQTDRRLKRRKIREMTQELRVLDKLIKEIGISKLAASINAGTFDINKLSSQYVRAEMGKQENEGEKKIRQPTNRLVQQEDVPVPLTEDCKGTMRLLKPVGSVFEDRWVSVQRRNLVEPGVPNNPCKQNATRPWTVIVH